MNKNTGARTVTTTNFVTYVDTVEVASSTWAPEFIADAESVIEDYAELHLRDNLDGNGYRVDVEVYEYNLPGLRVVALVEDGIVLTVFEIADVTATKLHRAVRREHPVTVTYTKADSEETVRTLEPTSLATTKAGDVIVKAVDRKSGKARSFRLDRISAYTVHRTRRTVRTERPAPSKAELWDAWTAVRHLRHGLTGTVVPGTRAYGPGGYSLIVKLDDSTVTPGGTTRWSESELTTV